MLIITRIYKRILFCLFWQPTLLSNALYDQCSYIMPTYFSNQNSFKTLVKVICANNSIIACSQLLALFNCCMDMPIVKCMILSLQIAVLSFSNPYKFIKQNWKDEKLRKICYMLSTVIVKPYFKMIKQHKRVLRTPPYFYRYSTAQR